MKVIILIGVCIFCYWLGGKKTQITVIIKEVQLQRCEDLDSVIDKVQSQADWNTNTIGNYLPYWQYHDIDVIKDLNE